MTIAQSGSTEATVTTGSVGPFAPYRIPRPKPWLPVAAVDALVLVGAVLTADLGRRLLPIFPNPDPASVLRFAPLLIAAWLGMSLLFGAYNQRFFVAGSEEYKRVLHGSAATAGLVATTAYLADVTVPRGFFVLFVSLGALGLLTSRWAARRVLHQAHRDGRLRQRTLIVGPPSHVDEIAAVLRRESWMGYDVVGALTPPTYAREETDSGIRIWGNPDDVGWATEALSAHFVLIAGGAYASASKVRETVWALEDHPVQVAMAPGVLDFASDRIQMRPVGGMPLVHLEASRWSAARARGKRVFDIAAAGLILLAAAPVLLGAALAVRRHDGGDVLFRQRRAGLDGEEFDCLKLRTMVPDAEDRLARLKSETGFAGGLFKLREDPRITPVGRVLRKYSIDELPQLVNVLRGEMSLVGPRPPLMTEVEAYDRIAHRRLRVRPGMTGLWQVSGRSTLSWQEALRLDLYYVDNWSMVQDLVILLRTFRAVFKPDGAF